MIAQQERFDTTSRIHFRHPVREQFAARSSGPVYYTSKGLAVNAFDSVLQEYDLFFCREDSINLPGDEGNITLRICNDYNCVVGYAHLSWYRMPSGRYEFTGYIG